MKIAAALGLVLVLLAGCGQAGDSTVRVADEGAPTSGSTTTSSVPETATTAPVTTTTSTSAVPRTTTTSTTYPPPQFDASGYPYRLSPATGGVGTILVADGDGCTGERGLMVGVTVKNEIGINLTGSQPGESAAPNPDGTWHVEMRVPSGIPGGPHEYFWVTAVCYQQPADGLPYSPWEQVRTYAAQPFLFVSE
ncbi:MAG TPA: hypothetical protein VFJ85_18335 [Acidimicrobiales bacterium]|nr:hypothetical protein [Acidimicrobiales bacterium]